MRHHISRTFGTPAARFAAVACTALLLTGASVTRAETTLKNYDGVSQIACPCFVTGEVAGVVLEAPAQDYPLRILRIGIAWGSQFGGNPQQIEQSVNVYADGLPNPGTPIFELLGPQLSDGFVNEFNIDPLPGDVVITSGPFTVGLEFLNTNAFDYFAPSVVHDGTSCQSGKNVVFAIPGGWSDACLLGVTGDWVMYVVYETVVASGAGDPQVLSSTPAFLTPATPNPFGSTTEADLLLAEPGRAAVSVYDVRGRRVATILDETLGAGTHRVRWDGRDERGESLASGVYFLRMTAGGRTQVRKVALTR